MAHRPAGTRRDVSWHWLAEPFAFGFMRRALAGCVALSLAGPPLGVVLVVRRMSLTSDVLQHGILPGVALGALAGGFSLWAMGLGGVLAGFLVVLLAGGLARASGGREDSRNAAPHRPATGGGGPSWDAPSGDPDPSEIPF